MIERPKACVIRVDGINCNNETAEAFEKAGADVSQVHVNELKSGDSAIKDSQILVISGGFSYGDDIRSGVVLATELMTKLGDQVGSFLVPKNRVVVGICNGFQVLVEGGLLPFHSGERDAALLSNQVGHFRCDTVNLKVEKDASPILEAMPDYVQYPVAHGEGRFTVTTETLTQIEAQGLVSFRYADRLGNPTMDYPDNPNGAMNAIAGIVDPTGRILGLMPHPERMTQTVRHPNWRRMSESKEPDGVPFFRGIVNFVNQS